jgi:hypothetical protein
MRAYGKGRFPERLFIVEGIDGSGTFFSEWNSSALVRDVTRRGKNNAC